MRKACFILTSLAGAALFTGCNQQSQPASGATNSAPAAANTTTAAASGNTNILATEQERESYAIGMYLGAGWKSSGATVDGDAMARGVQDSMSGHPLMSEQQEHEALGQFKNTLMAGHQKQMQEQAEKNRAAGEAFLAQNKTKPGVVTLPSGLQYKIIKDGTGATPGSNDMVSVNYKLTLIDGTVIDDSSVRHQPADLPVSPMIPGWTEALQKMKVGSKWEIYIPSNLAYGAMGRPPRIEPNETLIFEVELLGIKARPQPARVQPLTSDIIEVPSTEEMKKGAKIETIKAADAQKMAAAATNSATTNSAATNSAK